MRPYDNSIVNKFRDCIFDAGMIILSLNKIHPKVLLEAELRGLEIDRLVTATLTAVDWVEKLGS